MTYGKPLRLLDTSMFEGNFVKKKTAPLLKGLTKWMD